MPNLPPSWKSEIQETVQKAAETSRKREETQRQQEAAAVSEQIKRLVDAYNCERNKPERKDKVKIFLDISTFLLLLITAIFTGLTLCVFRGQLAEMKRDYDQIVRSANAAVRQNILAYPAHIIAPLVKAYPAGHPDQSLNLEPGAKIEIIVRAINHGRNITTLDEDGATPDAICTVIWQKGPLSMARPYDHELRENHKWVQLRGDHDEIIKALAPGNEAQWKLETVVPPDFSDKTLYVIGFVRYWDDKVPFKQYLGIARKYVREKGRFIPEKDEAYEYAN
jgi:hypothetical protein